MRDPVGDAIAASCTDRMVLARLAGPIGEAARAACEQLAALGDRERRVARATWSAVARSPVPAGLRGIDPSWIEAALADLPPRARDAIGGGASDPVSVWLARSACAWFPPMPAIDRSLVRPRTPREVGVLAAEAMHDWLEETGADQLAFALGDRAGDAVPAVGERLRLAIARITQAPREGQLGSRRAAIDRAHVSLDAHALVRIGARAIAVHLGPLDRRRLVLRLPRPLGLTLADDLRRFAAVDDVPAWSAMT